jgi:two-component system, OmpR family, phosphate regulon response regulator PhoB
MVEQVRTLVVDDEERIRFFLEETLRRVGHIVTQAADGEEALDRLREIPFDLAIVDLNLGGRIDGLRVLEAARWRWPSMAVVILTAHGSLESAMDAIREGVDGYLLKPVEPAEVRRAADEAMEKRRALIQKKEGRVLQRGPFFVDLTKHEVTLNGKDLNLTPREFSLLTHMMQNAHRVIPPPELVEVVRDYKPEHMHEARQIIKWYIYRLRQKVEPDPSNPQYIINVRGVGYRFQE